MLKFLQHIKNSKYIYFQKLKMKKKTLLTSIRKLFYGFRNYLSFVVPKKNNYWVFRQGYGESKFTGNIRALMLYLKENYPEIKIVLVSFDERVIEEASVLGFKTKGNHITMNIAYLRAEYIFIDSNDMDFANGKYSFIQLWHGSGFKNVGLLNHRPSEKKREILKQNYKKYKLITTTSESDSEKQNKSFNTDVSVVTGYPRNDLFFESKNYFKVIKKKYNLEKYRKIITYAPTFRDDKTKVPFSIEFWDELNDYLVETNSLFVVKKHYMDQFLKVPIHFENIVDLTFQIDDVQELLLITDVLISDYSSISTDFVLTGRPIFIYAYDLQDYMNNCRSIYYNITEVLPQPFLHTDMELLAAIKDENFSDKPITKASYIKFQTLFHKYLDGNSSKRVVEEVLKLKTKV